MSEINPIKRSVQLQPLSREHHNGLLFVWKIKQGLENNTHIDTLRKYTIWFWKNHIRPHFRQEEKLLMPHISVDHPFAVQLKEEHDHIKELIISIDRNPDKLDFIHLVGLIERHIRFEERELFTYLEEHLSTGDLQDIFNSMEKLAIPHDEGWTEEFWINKKEIVAKSL